MLNYLPIDAKVFHMLKSVLASCNFVLLLFWFTNYINYSNKLKDFHLNFLLELDAVKNIISIYPKN